MAATDKRDRDPGRARVRLTPDERRESILDVATRLLLDGRVTHLTMDRVAAEADVAKATVYYYWDSRADLFHDLQERYIVELLSTTAKFTNSEIQRDPLAALEAFLTDTATLHYKQRTFLIALAREIPIEEERIIQSMHGLMRRFVDTLSELGVPPAGTPDFVVSFLLTGLHGVLLQVFSDPDLDLESVIRQSAEICRRILGLTPDTSEYGSREDMTKRTCG